MWPQAQAAAAGGNLTSAQLVIALSIALALGSAVLAGCGGSSNEQFIVIPTATATPEPTATPTGTATATSTATPSPTPTPIFAAGSSAVAVDCQTQRAWVALNNTGGPCNGKVVVVDLSVNPDSANPVVATIDLGNNDIPSGVALTDTKVLVVAGDVGLGGHLYIFNKSDNSPVAGSPFSFPAGSDTFGDSGVVFDPVGNRAIISMCDTAGCGGEADAATGWAFFNLSTNTFGSVIEAPQPDCLSLDPNNELVVAPADAIDPPSSVNAILAGDSTRACTLSDKNLTDNPGDPDGAWGDPSTGLFALGNFFDSTVTVLNLNGASFSGGKAPCTLKEAGTNPNSVGVNVFAATGHPADVVTINPLTHQVLVSSDFAPDVGLISLPSTPKTQLAGPLTSEASVMPAQPDGNPFAAVDEPFSSTVDTCRNMGLIANSDFTFLAQIDLATLQSSPAKISTPLPAGKCFDGFKVSCNNGNGVTFFPLPALRCVGGSPAGASFAHKTHSR